jgi:hypothetical protein
MLLIEKIAKEIEGPDTDDYLLSKAVVVLQAKEY